MDNLKRLVYFMRKSNRSGKRYEYIGQTEELAYRHPYFMFFVVSAEAANWIHDISKNFVCKLQYEKLRATLKANDNSLADEFIDSEDLTECIDISNQIIDVIKYHVDYSEMKNIEDEVAE